MDKYFFPGGNTPHGFVNCFDDILPQYAARRVYYVKGGSGVGKSTLMQRVGERYQRQGWDVEYFNCSSDPASLDGVALPALGVALMDVYAAASDGAAAARPAGLHARPGRISGRGAPYRSQS